MARSETFKFDGGAATYVGTAILAFLVTFVTFGIGAPFGIVLRSRWRAKHTYINGQRLVFNGSAWSLWGNWMKWYLLTFITLGVYSFWVVPRLTKWTVEHTDFDPTYQPTQTATGMTVNINVGSQDQVPSIGPPPMPGLPPIPVRSLTPAKPQDLPRPPSHGPGEDPAAWWGDGSNN